jgi:hypothetical protein
MAIYHLSVKTVSRSAGRSATAAAAYRAGVSIADERTGEVFDYTRKGGVLDSEIVLPERAPEWAHDRSALWNQAERSETRKNSTVAREFEIALPSELSAEERKKIALDFAREIVSRHGCAADLTIHAPGRGGDDRNHHAHILCTTRRLKEQGFTEKTRELDDQKTGEVTRWRERFADLQNERLRQNGAQGRVDHRSHEERGIDKEPTKHLGVHATHYERRTGQESDRRKEWRDREEAQKRIESATQQRRVGTDEIGERLSRARDAGLEKKPAIANKTILDLSMELEKAKRERGLQAKHAQEKRREPSQRERFEQAQQQEKQKERGQGKDQEERQAKQEATQRERFEQAKKEREEQERSLAVDRGR